MNIDPHLRLEGVARIPDSKTVTARRKVENQTDFAEAALLERALRDVPEVRLEHVSRAVELVESKTYPPPEMIRRLSRLLAKELQESEQ